MRWAPYWLRCRSVAVINEALGHSVGDDLLRSVAVCLLSCVRKSDLVCRQGGDEFVVLTPDNENQENAARTAQKILSTLGLPHHVEGYELHITAS
jgi:diguanylate cyclase (GGDEF)-like protein